MRILITGSNGFIAQHVMTSLSAGNDFTVLGTSRSKSLLLPNRFQLLDITNRRDVSSVVSSFDPDLIIHAAANGSADDCELRKSVCDEVNVTGTKNIADAVSGKKCRIIFLSTDFVFDGNSGPYKESDPVSPVNYYGASKVKGERIIADNNPDNCIVRLCSVYGKAIVGQARGIVTLTKDRLSKGIPILVVNDQIRTPTLVGDIANAVKKIIEINASGIFHISGEEIKTPYQMAVEAANSLNLDKQLIVAVSSSELNEPARRPLKTGFIIEKAKKELGFIPSKFQDGIMQS